MKTSGKFLIAFISSILLWPIQIANSCAWYYEEDEISISPFDQTLANLPELNPFYYSYHYYNGYSWYSGDDNGNNKFDDRSANIDDWYKHFNGIYERDDFEMLIYKTDQYGYENIKNYIRDKKNGPQTLLNYPLVNDWKNGLFSEEFQYLYFAKQVEPFVQGADAWDPQPVDTTKMIMLLKEAKDEIPVTKNLFVRQRYIYQAMRLAHYSKNYDACLKLYDQYQYDLTDGSLISWWCLSLKAGAHWRLHQFAKSSYYNSLVFDHCPSRKLYSERDFYIDDDATWQTCMSMCKNDHERAVLWALTGINQNNAALTALRAIVQLEPESPYSDLLLAREMEKIQRNYMPARDDADFTIAGTDWYIPDENKNIDTMAAFIENALSGGRVRTPSFWFSARAFIAYLNKDYDGAVTFSDKGKTAAGNNIDLQQQAFVIKAIATVKRMEIINAENEKIALPLLSELLPLRKGTDGEYFEYNIFDDAYRLMMFHLFNLYADANALAKAEICRSQYMDIYDIYYDPKKEAIEGLLQYVESDNNSPMDAFLKNNFQYSHDALLDIRGTLALQDDNYTAAVSWFSKIEDVKTTNYMHLPTDPFLIHIWDCHDCDYTDHPGTYTKLQLAQEIVSLRNALQSNTSDKALLYHKLGNAFYNMTHFGNSWMAKDYYLCAGCMDYDDSYGSQFELYDCDRAAEYYQMAVDASNDKEFKALNIFLLSKCEQNKYYLSDDFEYENTSGKKEEYRKNFELLNNKFRNTSFYKQVIDECKYFDYYVQHH